jgi:succinate dehydrogenase / fumarate reductase iron-sulfur subunit
VVDNRYDPLVWLGRKIFRRDQIPGYAGPATATRLPVSEVTYDKAGAGSPYGDDVTFPLPTESLTYKRPQED